MATGITEDAGAIRIDVTGGATARLFGLPFLLVGGWLGWQMVGAASDLVTGRAAVGDMAIGLFVLSLVTGMFLLPGWMLTLSSGRVEIDRTGGTVTSVRDYRLYQQRERRSLQEFSAIAVDVLTTAANPRRRARPTFQVELVDGARGNVLVGLADDGDSAMAMGRRLGALTGLPVDDRRFSEPTPDSGSEE